jgi:hypothetical protein
MKGNNLGRHWIALVAGAIVAVLIAGVAYFTFLYQPILLSGIIRFRSDFDPRSIDDVVQQRCLDQKLWFVIGNDHCNWQSFIRVSTEHVARKRCEALLCAVSRKRCVQRQ